jgi:hypothetical protein
VVCFDYEHPRVVSHPDEWTSTNPKAGHTLVGPRCTARTAAGPRCKAAASVIEGSPPHVVCGQHSTKTVRTRGPRGGSLKDRLRSRASDDYDALEDELLGLAQTATATKTFTCKGCKRKNTVEVADVAVRLRAIEAIFDCTGAARATAASSVQDDLTGRAGSTTLAEIQGMDLDDLVRLRDYTVASDADVLAASVERMRTYRSLKADHGSSHVVERDLFSMHDERTLKEIYSVLREHFEGQTVA